MTQLGGCERVIQTKHWRDAAESFNFPETITSVSFSLRKAYITFLWDYEQVRLQLAMCFGYMHSAPHLKKRKEKTKPFGANSMRS